jgi:regulator of sigma E protease
MSASGQRESAVLGETEYSVNWLPFGGFVRIAGENPEESDKREAISDKGDVEDKKRLFSSQAAWKRITVLVAGVAVNFIIGWWLLSATLMLGSPSAVIITRVAQNSPAEAAGLRTGDAVSGFSTTAEFVAFVNANRGTPIELRLLRGGEEKVISLTPRVNPPPKEGAVGVELAEGGEPARGFASALGEGLQRSFLVIGLTFQALGELFRGLFTAGAVPGDIVGPLGIFAVAHQTGQLGIVYLLQLLSLISLNLAVINLIPFPALDGGRILFVFIEKLKGSPIPKKVEFIVNGVGFALLLLLMVLVTVWDIGRFS